MITPYNALNAAATNIVTFCHWSLLLENYIGTAVVVIIKQDIVPLIVALGCHTPHTSLVIKELDDFFTYFYVREKTKNF